MSLLADRIRAANAVILAGGDLGAIRDYFAPEYVIHGTDRDFPGGCDAVAKVVEPLRAAFPDLELEVEILVEGESRIAWQRTLRGTHRGAFKGFPATGRRLVWRDMVTSAFRGGLIVEDWVLTDLAERLLAARKG